MPSIRDAFVFIDRWMCICFMAKSKKLLPGGSTGINKKWNVLITEKVSPVIFECTAFKAKSFAGFP